MCDHTSIERGQTEDEMMAPLTPEEERVWETEPPDSPRKIEVGRKVKEEQRRKRVTTYTIDVLKVPHSQTHTDPIAWGWYSYSGTLDIRVDCPKCGRRETWFIAKGHIDAEGCTIGDGDHACPECGVFPRQLKLLDYSGWPWPVDKITK
jgi:hypothetical protein